MHAAAADSVGTARMCSTHSLPPLLLTRDVGSVSLSCIAQTARCHPSTANSALATSTSASRGWRSIIRSYCVRLQTHILTAVNARPPRRPTITANSAHVLAVSLLAAFVAETDVTAKVASLSVEEKKDTEEKKDSKGADKKGAAATAAKKAKAKPAADDDDDDEEDDEDEDDDDEEEAKPAKATSAAAIRSKPVLSTGVYIRKEQRSKHKYITSVKGMDAFGCDLKKAAKSFSKKSEPSDTIRIAPQPHTSQLTPLSLRCTILMSGCCHRCLCLSVFVCTFIRFACSASVVKVNEGGQEIQIQGDVSLDLPDFIVTEFKEVPKKELYFIDKANKKTRAF